MTCQDTCFSFIVGLADNGSWSLTGSKCSPHSSRYRCTCFISRTSQWWHSWCRVSCKSNGYAGAVVWEHAQEWIPCNLNSWFQMPERWAILITTQNALISSHVCNDLSGHLLELPSSDLLTMDLDRWQAASVVQTALDIVVQALSLERHNDSSHDAVFLPNPTVLLLLSFESMLRYESHETWTRDFRCQSVEPYW